MPVARPPSKYNFHGCFLIRHRLERDISKILDKLDYIENNLPVDFPRPRSPSLLTPPEDDLEEEEDSLFVRPIEKAEAEEDEIGSNPILLVSSMSQAITAADSLKQNNFYVLHEALGVPFDYPDCFKQETNKLDLPFTRRFEGPLPVVRAAHAERFQVWSRS